MPFERGAKATQLESSDALTMGSGMEIESQNQTFSVIPNENLTY